MMHQLYSTENNQTSFPVKLYTMLELFDGVGNTTSNTDRSEIVAWSPHGRAFAVHDEERFMSEVSPLFYRQTKINSFYRQLHLWGFRRFSKGTDCGSWYNENFLRGRSGQLKNMLRIKIKKNVGAKHARARPEPDLYALPPLTTARRLSSSCPNLIKRSASSPPRPQQVSSDMNEFTRSKSVELDYSRRNRHEYTRQCSRDSFLEKIEAMEFSREVIGSRAEASTIEPLPMHEICSYQDMVECVEVIEALRVWVVHKVYRTRWTVNLHCHIKDHRS